MQVDQWTVRGKPFTAQFEWIRTATAMHAGIRITTEVGAIYRDRAGRQRTEYWLDSQSRTIESVEIMDPVAGTLLFLTCYAKRAVLGSALAPMISAYCGLGDGTQRYHLKRTEPGNGDLVGEGEVEGIPYRSYRLSAPDVIVEYSYSEELREILLIGSLSLDCEQRLRVFNFQLGEPDGALFAIPHDYAISSGNGQ